MSKLSYYSLRSTTNSHEVCLLSC